ncbi:MAG: pyrophosphatase PpaX [Tissierellales bacterium]|nr:pyrophosphatase PpaX [Tissierellales bacterium]
MIKAVLFDLDGTLINTNELIVNTFQYIFKKHLNIDVDRKEITDNFGELLSDTIERYAPNDVEFMVKKYKEYNEIMHDELTMPIIGVKEGIKKLRDSGYKMGIVTSKRRAMTEKGLRLFDLYDDMDVIVTPEDTKRHKPEADPILKACELLKLNVDEVIMVGDTHNDILGGKAAKCKTCLVRYTGAPLDKLLELEPDYVIDSIDEVLDIIK